MKEQITMHSFYPFKCAAHSISVRLSALALILFLSQCARELAPTGGLKDEIPPKLDSLKSTPNYQTMYQKSDIVLQFDEWLQIKDAAGQVFVSPPLMKKPLVSLKGKKVVLSFDENENLRPNTTYTIHFGTSIQDLNAGNTVKDLRYVMSTGQIIDSLQVRGKVVDALTGLPVKNASVVLHYSATDSTILKELPYYLAFTDETGQYKLQNIRADSYRIAAYIDDNKNNKWTSPLESIAFYDTLLNVQATSAEAPILVMFKNALRKVLVEKDINSYGTARFVYGDHAANTQVIAIPDSVSLVTEINLDTVKVWYDRAPASEWFLVLNTDTIKMRGLQRSEFLAKHRVQFAGAQQPAKTAKTKLSQNIAAPTSGLRQAEQTVTQTNTAYIDFMGPIARFDTSFWQVKRMRDSTEIRNFTTQASVTFATHLDLGLPLDRSDQFQLTLLPGAVTDYWGIANQDTLKAAFRVVAGEDIGQLDLTLKALVPQSGYVIELKLGNQIMKKQAFIADNTEKLFHFDGLVPGNYTVNIIIDSNANGRWDTGDYFARKQPELVYQQSIETIRPNWTIDAAVTIGAPKNNKSVPNTKLAKKPN
jgi:hypothetical protein